MFRKDRMGIRGGVLLYIKETIPAYEVQLQEEADCLILLLHLIPTFMSDTSSINITVTAGEGCVSLGSAKIGSNRHSAEFFLVYSCLFVLYVR